MYTEEVKVLTLHADTGKFLTNYPNVDINAAQVCTVVFIREDRASGWREIDSKEKDQIIALQEEVIIAQEEEEKARAEELSQADEETQGESILDTNTNI